MIRVCLLVSLFFQSFCFAQQSIAPTPTPEPLVVNCLGQTRCLELEFARQSRVNAEGAAYSRQQIIGYGILVGTMVGSAALTSKLTASLPQSAKFLSQLVTQLSTIGIYVMGAPIWKPISSLFENLAFRWTQDPSEQTKRQLENAELERLWHDTQASYSQNAQMSRNLINSFILSVQSNFLAAHQAMRSDEPGYAVDQIAEAAIRMRVLFFEIPPEDASVALAVRTAFVNHVRGAEHLYEPTLERILVLDPQAADPAVRERYERVLRTWLL